ncbi:MAG TPA: hypothetical protein VF933_20155 [Streptosporangiaceae bacterium]
MPSGPAPGGPAPGGPAPGGPAPGGPGPGSPAPGAAGSVAAGDDALGADLYGRLAGPGNLVFSPASIATALRLVLLGPAVRRRPRSPRPCTCPARTRPARACRPRRRSSVTWPPVT